MSGGEAQRAKGADGSGEAARERGRVEQFGDRGEVDVAGRFVPHTAVEADLAVGEEAAGDDADADVGVSQLGGAVIVIRAAGGADARGVRIEADCRGELGECVTGLVRDGLGDGRSAWRTGRHLHRGRRCRAARGHR